MDGLLKPARRRSGSWAARDLVLLGIAAPSHIAEDIGSHRPVVSIGVT